MLLFFLNRQEYVSELFHYLHSSTDSPQLLALLESFLFSVVRDVKHYASENQRLEEALKRFVIPCLLSLNLITIIYSSHQSSLVWSWCTVSVVGTTQPKQCCQLSQIIRETPDFGPYLQVSRLEYKISRIIAEVKHFFIFDSTFWQ